MSDNQDALREANDQAVLAAAAILPDDKMIVGRADYAELVEALSALLKRDERNTCQHEETHRGGAIWTICDYCGKRWADDEGGMPEWQDPKEWVAACAALAKVQGNIK